MKRRLINIGVALSQCLHVILTLGDGDPRMTTSARIGRQVVREERWAKIADWIISTILFDHPQHCLRIYLQEREVRLHGGDHV